MLLTRFPGSAGDEGQDFYQLKNNESKKILILRGLMDPEGFENYYLSSIIFLIEVNLSVLNS